MDFLFSLTITHQKSKIADASAERLLERIDQIPAGHYADDKVVAGDHAADQIPAGHDVNNHIIHTEQPTARTEYSIVSHFEKVSSFPSSLFYDSVQSL